MPLNQYNVIMLSDEPEQFGIMAMDIERAKSGGGIGKFSEADTRKELERLQVSKSEIDAKIRKALEDFHAKQ